MRIYVFVGSALLLLPGCQASTESAQSSSIDSRLLQSARNGGASSAQLEVLDDGTVTFQEYQAAVGRSLTCIRDAGIDVIGDSVTQARGFPEINYSFAVSSPGRSDEQTLAIADECMSTHSFFVEAAYQTSPGAIEAQEVQFEPYRDTIVACIRANGGDVMDDAGRSDVLIAAGDLLADTGVDCADDAGYTG